MSESLLIAAHGSRDEAGVEECLALAAEWAAVRSDRLQAVGFLEFARPSIGRAIDDLVDRGARRIVVAPAMLTAAGHVKNDVPSEIHAAQTRHPRIEFVMARALDVHPALLDLCAVRFREALAGRVEVAPDRTLLLLVGRGTSDPDANANVARVSRFLCESYKAGWANVAFSGLAEPGVDHALEVCRKLGFARIVVQPYFLFEGLLLQRVRAAVQRHDALDSHADIVCTAHLGVHPLLVRAFEDRVHEALHGDARMSCDVCKYRVRLTGREADLGAPQVGHHHGVRAPDDHDHNPALPAGPAWEPYDPDDSRTRHAWDARLLERLELVHQSRPDS